LLPKPYAKRSVFFGARNQSTNQEAGIEVYQVRLVRLIAALRRSSRT
jgi:hypothetical protein